VCRVSVIGRGPLHGELRREVAAKQLLERIRERFAGEAPFIWVQRIGIDSRPQVDLTQRMDQQDLLAEVLSTAKECRDTPGGLSALYEGALAELWENTRVTKAQFEHPSDAQVAAILAEAELLCLDLLEDAE
jgi:hypothetical protein